MTLKCLNGIQFLALCAMFVQISIILIQISAFAQTIQTSTPNHCQIKEL